MTSKYRDALEDYMDLHDEFQIQTGTAASRERFLQRYEALLELIEMFERGYRGRMVHPQDKPAYAELKRPEGEDPGVLIVPLLTGDVIVKEGS